MLQAETAGQWLVVEYGSYIYVCVSSQWPLEMPTPQSILPLHATHLQTNIFKHSFLIFLQLLWGVPGLSLISCSRWHVTIRRHDLAYPVRPLRLMHLSTPLMSHLLTTLQVYRLLQDCARLMSRESTLTRLWLTYMSRVRVESTVKIKDMSWVRVESLWSSFESELSQLGTAWIQLCPSSCQNE